MFHIAHRAESYATMMTFKHSEPNCLLFDLRLGNPRYSVERVHSASYQPVLKLYIFYNKRMEFGARGVIICFFFLIPTS